jgi:hypothetical protein
MFKPHGFNLHYYKRAGVRKRERESKLFKLDIESSRVTTNVPGRGPWKEF